MKPMFDRRSLFFGLAALAAGVFAPVALGGGSPENVVLIMDPGDRDALYVGNYYRQARNIPDSNIIYMAPGAANYATFSDLKLDALFGSLTNADITDHADYIVIPSGNVFYVPAAGYITDACSPVTRFSISGAYTLAFVADEILGGLPVSNPNRYYSSTDQARGFDSSLAYLNGAPSNSPSARRYFIGAQLGYSGAQGNTPAQTIAMIDRSVGADGTRPAGRFYFMETTDEARSGPRDPYFDAAVASIIGLGGQALHMYAILPSGNHDCLGIMTGWPNPDLVGTDMTILPGAFGDHLTSYAAKFDTGSQTKVSAWITKGASGSWGTVEEPCNYPGKFPHPRMHVFYFQGLSLGEAALRSAAYSPFQALLYGDPITRPFAYLPVVDVPDPPAGPVSGTVRIDPTASTAHPSATIAYLDLLIDGVRRAFGPPGGAFNIDTTLYADGWHDLRVLAYDNTLVKSVGRWVGSLTIDNRGRSVTIDPLLTTGNWATPFSFDITTTGAGVLEVRVVQNGRVLAAAPGSAATLVVNGLTLGSGPARVQAEAFYADGQRVRSAPVVLDIAHAPGTPGGQPPAAFSYIKPLRADSPAVVELPATFDDPNVPLTFEVLSNPVQATIPPGQSGPYRLVRPSANASGLDSFTFRVTSAAGNSQIVTVTLDFGVVRGDLNCDGWVDFGDIGAFVLRLTDLAAWQATYPGCPEENGDVNGDGTTDFGDINPFVQLLVG